MGSIEELVRHLRAFDADATVAKELRREVARVPETVTAQIRAHAEAILPASGGLGGWVAASDIKARVKLSGRTVSVTLIGSRKSIKGKKSDLRAINRGRVMHPSWGRRRRGQWHLQMVQSGWFTDPVLDTTEWRAAAERAAERATAALSA